MRGGCATETVELVVEVDEVELAEVGVSAEVREGHAASIQRAGGVVVEWQGCLMCSWGGVTEMQG